MAKVWMPPEFNHHHRSAPRRHARHRSEQLMGAPEAFQINNWSEARLCSSFNIVLGTPDSCTQRHYRKASSWCTVGLPNGRKLTQPWPTQIKDQGHPNIRGWTAARWRRSGACSLRKRTTDNCKWVHGSIRDTMGMIIIIAKTKVLHQHNLEADTVFPNVSIDGKL